LDFHSIPVILLQTITSNITAGNVIPTRDGYMEQMTKSEQVEAVSFDQNGNVVVNKETSMSKKLVARRAIEAHLEKKRLEQDLEAYSFE
jgi:predicted RND superfamily exporter protein|tara:strand:+ start:32 stop:298 length:267 start_codon:yes stop_codon:yes gene_type:complete